MVNFYTRYGFLPITLIIAASMSGCATPTELRQRTPEFVISSKLDARRVAACISEKWENALPLLGTQPVNLKLTKNGYAVAHGIEETIHLADISDTTGGGSVTTYYKNRSGLIEFFNPAVKACQSE